MKNNDLGKGIATAAIWIGTGISAFGCGVFVVFVALAAFMATDAIWD